MMPALVRNCLCCPGWPWDHSQTSGTCGRSVANTAVRKSPHVKRILIAVSFLVLASAVAILVFWRRPIAADVYPNEVITVDGKPRSYRLVVPHTLPKPAPIVFAFHGIGDSTESMANSSRLDRLASRNGFILAYPAAQFHVGNGRRQRRQPRYERRCSVFRSAARSPFQPLRHRPESSLCDWNVQWRLVRSIAGDRALE